MLGDVPDEAGAGGIMSGEPSFDGPGTPGTEASAGTPKPTTDSLPHVGRTILGAMKITTSASASS